MATVYVLIGLPASGKSTWREKFLQKNQARVCSSDDVIDRLCAEAGLTYNDGFDRFVGQAGAIFNNDVAQGFKSGEDLIIDRTNMGVKARKKFLQLASKYGYRKVAVNFAVTDSVIKARMKDRFEKTGKSVPDFVMKNMASNYVAPSKTEGFDEILTVRS